MPERDKITEIVQEITLNTYNDNVEYLREVMAERVFDGELRSVTVDEVFIGKFMSHIIVTTMELSAYNTMKILKKLNVDIKFPE